MKRPKGRLIFPDFTLQHTSGVTVYLEIFHRWHRGPLIQRMEELEKMKEPLILAIDRYLLKGLPSGDRQDALEDLDNSRHFCSVITRRYRDCKRRWNGIWNRLRAEVSGFQKLNRCCVIVHSKALHVDA
ncbi:DUF790 family protein [Aliamphritea spongicola]|nr:DUF790 family protein [Aliamphritea spongicola]